TQPPVATTPVRAELQRPPPPQPPPAKVPAATATAAPPLTPPFAPPAARAGRGAHPFLRASWKATFERTRGVAGAGAAGPGAAGFDSFWENALQAGFLDGSAAAGGRATADAPAVRAAA